MMFFRLRTAKSQLKFSVLLRRQIDDVWTRLSGVERFNLDGVLLYKMLSDAARFQYIISQLTSNVTKRGTNLYIRSSLLSIGRTLAAWRIILKNVESQEESISDARNPTVDETSFQRLEQKIAWLGRRIEALIKEDRLSEVETAWLEKMRNSVKGIFIRLRRIKKAYEGGAPLSKEQGVETAHFEELLNGWNQALDFEGLHPKSTSVSAPARSVASSPQKNSDALVSDTLSRKQLSELRHERELREIILDRLFIKHKKLSERIASFADDDDPWFQDTKLKMDNFMAQITEMMQVRHKAILKGAAEGNPYPDGRLLTDEQLSELNKLEELIEHLCEELDNAETEAEDGIDLAKWCDGSF